jgi:hypothetical protein
MTSMAFPLWRPDQEQTCLAAIRQDTLAQHVTQFEQLTCHLWVGQATFS